MLGIYDFISLGHSTLEFKDFHKLVAGARLKAVADIRATPGSARYPQFNEDYLESRLRRQGVEYLYIGRLGGRKAPKRDSPNLALEDDELRGYADYMQSRDFHLGLKELVKACQEYGGPVGVMCSCGNYRFCHRRLVADALKLRGWSFGHIYQGKVFEHELDPYCKIRNNQVLYPGGQLARA